MDSIIRRGTKEGGISSLVGAQCFRGKGGGKEFGGFGRKHCLAGGVHGVHRFSLRLRSVLAWGAGI